MDDSEIPNFRLYHKIISCFGYIRYPERSESAVDKMFNSLGIIMVSYQALRVLPPVVLQPHFVVKIKWNTPTHIIHLVIFLGSKETLS